MAENTINKFAILSAIWIIASNDENPIITYAGLRYRLRLPTEYDVRSLVHGHGELFRQGVPKRRLEDWKREMLGENHLPSWIREIDDKNERREAIERLSTDDVFRSQFRAEENADRSSLEVLDWGVQHIERLRKAEFESKDHFAKSWEIRAVFVLGLLNVIATLFTAFGK